MAFEKGQSGNPDGRPTKFKDEYIEQVYKLCLLGATDKEIADFFEVSESTIDNWKNEHSLFLGSIKEGKEQADMEVAEKLRERAKGFEWQEAQPVKLKEVKYDNGKRVSEIERVEIVMVDKVVPPDPTSAIFWLKNRRSQHWRDKQVLAGDPDEPIKHQHDGLDEFISRVSSIATRSGAAKANGHANGRDGSST